MPENTIHMKPGDTTTVVVGKTHVTIKMEKDGSVTVVASDPKKGLDEATLLEGDNKTEEEKPK